MDAGELPVVLLEGCVVVSGVLLPQPLHLVVTVAAISIRDFLHPGRLA